MTQFAWAGVAFIAIVVAAVSFSAIGLWWMGEMEDLG